MTQQENKPLAIALMLFGIMTMSAMDAVGKWLVSSDQDVIQILAIRGWVIVAVMLLWLLRPKSGGLSHLKTTRIAGHLIRVILGFAAPFLFFTALKTLPLVDTTVVVFGATFLMTALSVPLFKERVGPIRWATIIIGFIGVLVAMQPTSLLPGGESFRFELVYAIGASISYAFIMLSGRWLSTTESTFQLVFFFNFGVVIICSLMLPAIWVPISLSEFAIVALMAILAMASHFSLTVAFKTASVGVVAPFEYSGLIWALIFGYMLWGDIPALHVIIGASIIIGSGLFLLYRETRKQKPIQPTAKTKNRKQPRIT